MFFTPDNAIRLVLDRAATTEETVELLRSCDMFATSGRDYHYYITDASGDGRVVEYDRESEGREMVVTKMPAITNFYESVYRQGSSEPEERHIRTWKGAL